MRVRFDEVFMVNGHGSVSAKVPVVIGGVRLDPGMEFGCRVRIGNVHFAGVQGRDLEVERQGGVTYVLRPYARPPRPDRDRPLPRHRMVPAPGVPVEA
jgi:hypothetical protein